MTKKIIQIKQQGDALQLTWILNNICTNHCDYCPPSLHNGVNHHYDWDIAKDFINRLMVRYPKINCAISGGEPTVSPFFSELVRLFYDAGHTAGITSNAARSIKFWEENASYLSYICFSYHPSYDDPSFFEKAVLCAKLTSVTVRVMMDSRHWKKSIDMYERCKADPTIGVEPVRIIPEKAHRHVGDDYTPEQIAWLHSNGNQSCTVTLYKANPLWRQQPLSSQVFYDDGTSSQKVDTSLIIASDQNRFSGWACNIGLESLVISPEGNIKKGNCFQGGNLFNIVDHNQYEFPTTGELCLQKACDCNTDVRITKVKLFNEDDSKIDKFVQIKPVKNETEYALYFKKYIKPKKGSL